MQQWAAISINHQNAPKGRKKVQKMHELSVAAMKRHVELKGKFVPEKIDRQFDGLLVLGPFDYGNATYTGQYKDR